MGRSTTSCFKIITCGSDSADNNDLDVNPESKGSNDKRGWSFRKRSARHRVLSNTVISETTSSLMKESSESAELNFQPPNNSTNPEKISVIQCTDEKPQLSTPADLNNSSISEKISAVRFPNEKPQLSTLEDLKVSEDLNDSTVPDDTESKPDSSLDDESVVIVIQTAVRGFLAQRELLKLKNVIKLQAAVRGHLVRRHAVGTLRCVQAIVKMQVLVRARRARLSPNSLFPENKVDGKVEADEHSSKVTENRNSGTEGNVAYSSTEKLLGNRFARQLLESTPKTKPIHIKCDPAKQDSAWNWLERWMSVSYAKQTVKPESVVEPPEKENNEKVASLVETKIPSEVVCDSADSKSDFNETIVTSESEENLITYETDNFNFQPCQPTSSYRDDSEPSQREDSSLADVKENSIEITTHQNKIMQSDAISQTELDYGSSKPETESEQPKRSMKRFASENLEAEGKRFGYGSRKASNLAFIAAHSKFEELTTNSGRSVSSTHQDVLVDSSADTISSGTDALTRTKEPFIAENSVSHCSRNVFGGSECGTELSISSTLDSPDRSEVGTAEHEHQAKALEKEISKPNNTSNLDVQADDASSIQVCDVAHTFLDQPEKVDGVQDESVNSVIVTESPKVEHKPESSASDLHKELDSKTGHQAYRSSPEASPRSHITVPESQGTPSSQVSTKTKRNKSEKSGSSRKRKPLSVGKGSPSNLNHDSGARSSTEQLSKDQKNGKRRNSFGSTRTDNIDQEPGESRLSSSNSSLPHFMQATESARAKIQANNSPRSSPDVQDRDIYIKKRHSLPVANGRQGSPRIQRSMSQAQQVVKGNSTQPLHEKKWQR